MKYVYLNSEEDCMTVTTWAHGSLRPGSLARSTQTSYHLFDLTHEAEAMAKFIQVVGEGLCIGIVSPRARERLRRLNIPH